MREKGFQLIDLMVALLTLSVLAGLAAPRADAMVGRYRLEFAARTLLSQLVSARVLAVSKSAPVVVQVGTRQEGLGLAPTGDLPQRWTRLPSGVRLTRWPRPAVTFHARGNAAPGGTFELSSRFGQVRLIVAPSGRIRREQRL